MEDRFKFRAYLKDENIIIDDFFICPDRNSIIKNEFCVDFTSLPMEYKLEDIILMQCTGLKDKNDKLIYEGDIAEFVILEKRLDLNPIQSYYVVIEIKNFCIGFRHLFPELVHEDDREWFCFYREDDKEFWNINYFEIIGNIYENKELLDNASI